MSNTKKGKRKLSTRMKKAIRRTLGGIFLATALVIAFIPEKETEAAGETPKVTVSASDSSIPIIDDDDTIYTTGDGMFQFAYVEKGSGGDKVAVIVGYDYERSLDQGVLTIPNTVDAYVKYTHAQGTAGGYVAVGKSGNILYYPVYRTDVVKQPTGEKDEEGNDIMEDVEVQVLDRYDPCLYSTFEQWYYNADGTVRDPKDFYYDSKPSSTANTLDEYLPTTDEIYQRIQHATVAYISSQHVVKEGDTWVLDETPNVGIFSKATNITTLKTGGDLLGIGDYAFYECASLQGIELGDGANTIGNYAFANCVNLKYANFPTNSSIKSLGDHAFYNCRSLEEFTMPVAVTKIGDSAFEGCAGMTNIDLNAGGQQVLLQEVGPDIFKNCTSLECLIFPEYFNQEFDIAWLEGDTSLKYIKIPNVDMKMVATIGDLSFVDFMAQLPKEFYFEGPAESEIHDISKTNSYAFKYLDEEIYEKVINATGDAGSGQSVFRVNNFNELIYFYMDDTVKQIDIPGIIGPYKITVIGSDSFQANHRLTKITIPSTITEIQDNAFKGCHALKDVIFEEPISLTSIGAGAFDTQVIDPILDTCTLPKDPKLTFTAPAEEGSAPFDYAMDSANNINTGTQELAYITFYTGWPSNLTIKYNPDTDKNELVDYPKLLELASSYTAANYPYITPENAQAAATAYAAYQRGDSLSQDQKDILSSALNIVLPTGVESIKEGVFSGLDAEGKPVADESANTDVQTITTNGLDEIDPYTFAGCTDLMGAYINGDTTKLGDYAFKDCGGKLQDVDILSNLQEYGKRPFMGCTALEHVNFGTNPNYKCEQAVVYGMANGAKNSLLEVLQARGNTYGTGTLTKQELAGITAVAEEAVKDCDYILSADFSESKITELPISAFEDTDELYSVILPDGIRKIAKNAFKKSNIRYLELPKSLSVIDNSAFDEDPQTITFYCESDSAAADYASNFTNIVVSDKPITFKVTFYDDDAVTVLDTVEVPAGGNAETHITPTKAGFVFKGWMPSPVGVMEDMKTYATYVPEGEVTYTVQFVDHDDKVLSTQVVPQGGTAVTPVSPERAGYKFTGWRPSFSNVQDDLTVYAQYEKITTNNGTTGDGTDTGNGGNGGTGGTGGSGNKGTLYTLTVVSGDGSGSYASGATAILLADNPPSGKVFDKWVTDAQGVTFASPTTAATTITMPAANVTITATYKDGPSSGSSNNNNNNSNNGGSSSTVTKPNTTVTIDKDGIPNEGSASASVSGSTDNFILKITESAYAREEVEGALKETYGSLDDIRYFPMDISLYDSTGTKKVENTDALRVTVTLPIPEILVQYAGNNKVGYVVNGKLVNISPKFTTINGVPCITFVAPHFSPYVIYADTSDLSAGSALDTTPKTGDGIAPKWFLSMGLAAIAVFLFVKKDKKAIKVK